MDVKERFLKYVSFPTASDEGSESTPSSPSQLKLGAYLAEELKGLGLADARMDEKGYVYASLPASDGVKAPALGLISHMDTSPSVSGENIKARTVRYEGGDIPLSESETMRAADYPYLAGYKGQELIVTDGTTLLGADDKAGTAEIITAVEYLLARPEIPHRKISIGITPDEEIGRGADFFDLSGFDAEYAFTVDGGAVGEIEYENFNAASALVTVKGLNIHPGSAKNKMKNAALIAAELIMMLPPAEAPAHTEGYEGFYHVCGVKGDESLASVEMILRDHDLTILEQRKDYLTRIVALLNAKYGEGTVEVLIKDSYRNMKEKILPVMHIIDEAKAAMEKAGVTPKVIPIRGGTDGARLSFEGLPCPNLSTGGENFHGIHEFISVDSMNKMVEVLLNLARC